MPHDMDEPHKLIVQGEEPFNAEPDLAELVKQPITPNSLIYCRNHSSYPELDAATFVVAVDGLVENVLKLSLAKLQTEYSRVEVVAALQCAGNRRKKMVDHHGQDVHGIKWAEATICNVKWAGARLRDILRGATIKHYESKGCMHVCFGCSSVPCQDDEWYGASIPIRTVLEEDVDVLIAYEMNDKPLTPAHGYPLRVIMPGHSGARWVKWVDRITVSADESPNFYQQRDYKILPPEVKCKEVAERWWAKVPAIQENLLNSVIASHTVLEACRDTNSARLLISGYALSGLCPVKSVEVSLDKGNSWKPARITYQEGRWSWILWEAEVSCMLGRVTVWSRAEDCGGRKQSVDCPWNIRGVGYCAVGEHIVDSESWNVAVDESF